MGHVSNVPGQNAQEKKKGGQVGNLPHEGKLTEADRRFVKSLDVVELVEAQVNADAIKNASVVILANCGHLNDQQCGLPRET